MKPENPSLSLRLRRDESGAIVILVAIAIVALIGLAALAVDIGNLAYAQRRLQAVTDMSALAGAEAIGCGTCATNSAIATATSYSGTAGSLNAQRGLTITMSAGYPTLKCLTSISTACTATSAPNPTANAIMVQEQAKVPFLLGQIFNFGTVTLTATSLASVGGSTPPRMHIMIVLDNTYSMKNSDPTAPTSGPDSCGGISDPTRVGCALAGIQTLLTELWPSTIGGEAWDEVGLIVFPPVSSSTVANDSTCTSATITPEPYSSYPASSVYQVVPLTNNYRSSNNSDTLTNPGTTSNLVTATCQAGSSIDNNGVTLNCGSCTGDKVVGGEGTYLAGAITAAQSILAANSAPGVQNVMFVISDGGAGNAATLWQGSTVAAAAANGTTLTFPSGSVPADVIVGTSVNYECAITSSCTSGNIPAGTSVVSVDSTNTYVTLSNSVTGTVPSGTSINFGGYNQCHEAITAAQNAANAGTWVYAIAYQSYIELSPNSNSCSDTETPPISSCTTMQDIANSPGRIPDPAKFFSDPMGLTAPNGPCVSTVNGTSNSLVQIFSGLGFQFTALLPNNTN
jgi:hypothetical protein